MNNMNKKLILLAFFVAAVGVSIVSCKKDNSKQDDADELRGSLVSVDEGKTYSIEQIAEMLSEDADGSNAEESEARSEIRNNFLKRTKHLQDSLIQETGVNGLSINYNIYTYRYKSIDQLGKPITLSSMVAWPFIFYGWIDYDPDDILLYEHYTISDDEQAPSNSFSMQTVAILMSNEDLVIAPDLIGYGASRDRVHPYVNHEITAINSIDALKAGIEVFNRHKNHADLEDDWGLYVAGFSQGGSSALAVHKYLDTHPSLAEQYRFKASLCCSGPYSPEHTIKYYINSDKGLTYPFVVPMTLKSMMSSYPDIFSKYEEKDFYTQQYIDKAQKRIDQMFKDRNVTNTEISEEIANKLGLEKDAVKFSDIFNATALNQESQMYHDMMTALQRNELSSGWSPTHKIYLWHGFDDTVVPYTNATSVYLNFKEKTFLFTPALFTGHESACEAFLGQMSLYGPRKFKQRADEYDEDSIIF